MYAAISADPAWHVMIETLGSAPLHVLLVRFVSRISPTPSS
jgi:hypothetical protein